ncbi:MAG: RecQ family ATP-dependent DNA helicase [Caldilineaceae bacterium]|nr:RecQ family ATP-dependent DNA helicase [Caldilineaceae bacterium]
MSQLLLSQLAITPQQVAQLSSQLRNRVLNFLVRWEAWQEALDALPRSQLKRLVSLQDMQARALLGLGQIEASIAALEARLQKRDGVAARNQLVRHYLAKGDGDHSLTLAECLIETNAEYGPNWSVLGDVHLIRGDVDAAETAFLHHHQIARGSRQPLVGLMHVHHRRGDGVTAAAYAIRAYTVNEGEFPLSIPLLRELHAYFVQTNDTNRSTAAEAQLAERLVEEIAALRLALGSEGNHLSGSARPTKPAQQSQKITQPSIPPRRSAQPLPDLKAIALSDEEHTALLTAMRQHFGFTNFLPAQAEIMACTRRGEHVLAILPTGGGKSLCYQLPAFMHSGLTLVVSPLIALMKDQIDNLPPALRHCAIAIHGELDGTALQNATRDLANGRYQLVYVTPERLRQLPFLHAVRRCGITRLVIDEAHCVSVWGHDFRPDYLRLAESHRELGEPPILAMTATAPLLVRQDIERQLLGKTGATAKMRLIATDIFRPNLQLYVIKVRNEDEKRRQLLTLCGGIKGSGIVYARTRWRCEEFAAMLCRHGIDAVAYHAGIADRAGVQEQFMAGKVRIIVATIAFGMGIDKADIRFVIHYGLPDSLEAYYQEIGRAGRDGEVARCVLLHSTSDKALLTRHANESVLSIDFLRELYRALQTLLPKQVPGALPLEKIQRAVRCGDETQVRVALSVLEQVGVLHRYHDVPRVVTLERNSAQANAAFAAFAEEIRLPVGQRVERSFQEIACASQTSLTILEEQLHCWQQAGYLRYQTTMRDLLLALPTIPAETTKHIESLLDQYTTIQHQHVADIVAYARSGYCRHGYLANYLGGQERRACQSCDNCGTDSLPTDEATLPDEDAQLQFIMKALTEHSWGRRNLIALLRGDNALAERAHRAAMFGALAFRSEKAVSSLIDRLLEQGALAEVILSHGGVALEVTAQGRQFCNEHGEQ